MKIAIDARVINSGTGRYIERLLHYLEELDHDNDYLILVRKKDLGYYKPANPRFTVVEADFADYSLAEQTGFKRLLDSLRPDLVHFCMPQQPVLYRGRHVTTVHDLILLKTYNSDKNYIIYHLKQLVGKFVFWRLARTSRYVIVPTEFTKRELRQFAKIPANKIVVTYEGSDVEKVGPEPYEPMRGKQFLLYVGKQSDYKNVRRLMLAHQQLRKTKPDLQLVLAGRLGGKDGVPSVRNKQWAGREGFANITFTDFVPDGQLAWLYQNCAAYVFPSLMEGFGLPGLEAMAQGAPVASSNATCLPEVYKDGAHYFDPLSVDDMARAIAEVLDDSGLRNQLRRNGKRVASGYSWRRMAEQTLEVYRRALG